MAGRRSPLVRFLTLCVSTLFILSIIASTFSHPAGFLIGIFLFLLWGQILRLIVFATDPAPFYTNEGIAVGKEPPLEVPVVETPSTPSEITVDQRVYGIIQAVYSGLEERGATYNELAEQGGGRTLGPYNPEPMQTSRVIGAHPPNKRAKSAPQSKKDEAWREEQEWAEMFRAL